MPKKILLAEDEEIIYNLLQKKLTQEGYSVVLAKNGEECLQQLPLQKPDLLLLDIIMPKKNGFDVMEAMKADENLRDIPVIIISNSGQPVELERAQELGALDWLIKTEFDPQEVINKVKKYIT